MPDPVHYPIPDQPLHIVIYFEDDAYIAQCLEHDIAAHGSTIEDAEKSFIKAYKGNVVLARQYDDPPFQLTPKAPPEFWHMWIQHTEAGSEAHNLRIPGFTVLSRNNNKSSEQFSPRACTVILATSLVA